MYWIEYDNKPILNAYAYYANGRKKKRIPYRYKRFKNILLRFRQVMRFGFTWTKIKVYHNDRLVIEVLPYKCPRGWERFRVRFHTNPKETKILVNLIKTNKFNVRTAMG